MDNQTQPKGPAFGLQRGARGRFCSASDKKLSASVSIYLTPETLGSIRFRSKLRDMTLSAFLEQLLSEFLAVDANGKATKADGMPPISDPSNHAGAVSQSATGVDVHVGVADAKDSQPATDATDHACTVSQPPEQSGDEVPIAISANHTDTVDTQPDEKIGGEAMDSSGENDKAPDEKPPVNPFKALETPRSQQRRNLFRF